MPTPTTPTIPIPPPISVPGKRLFVAGCIVLLLFSTVHMIPMLADLLTTPTEPVQVEAKRAMAAVTVDMGPFHSHWGKLNQLLSVSYSALLYFVVAVNLVALSGVVAQGRLRTLAMVNASFSGLLLSISLAFTFPPPAVFALIATILFVMAAMRAPR